MHLSESRQAFKFGLFGGFNSIGGLINTIMIYWIFMGDVWIFSDYLNVVLLRYDDQKNIYFVCWSM